MDIGDKRRGSTHPSDGSDEHWSSLVQDYVDDRLDQKTALRMHLAAQKDPRLQREIDETRQMFRALDSVVPAEPSKGFDEPILRSIPLSVYASAPRRSPRVILLGDPTESLAMRSWGWLQRLSLALLASHLAVAIVGRTPAAEPLGALGRGLGAWLEGLTQQTSQVGVLDSVAAALSSGYDALLLSVSSVAAGNASLAWPAALLSLAVLATLARRAQHRKEFPRAAEGHSVE